MVAAEFKELAKFTEFVFETTAGDATAVVEVSMVAVAVETVKIPFVQVAIVLVVISWLLLEF